MDAQDSTQPEPRITDAPTNPPATADELSPSELKARRILTIGLIVVGVLLVGLIVLLVFLSIGAYDAAYAGEQPSPGEVVVGLLRDTAIIFVAFETLVIGILLIILMIQMQSLISLLRNEIQPLLEAANETVATVRGTTQFVSHNVVSPVMKWSGYVAGVKRIIKELTGLVEKDS